MAPKKKGKPASKSSVVDLISDSESGSPSVSGKGVGPSGRVTRSLAGAGSSVGAAAAGGSGTSKAKAKATGTKGKKEEVVMISSDDEVVLEEEEEEEEPPSKKARIGPASKVKAAAGSSSKGKGKASSTPAVQTPAPSPPTIAGTTDDADPRLVVATMFDVLAVPGTDCPSSGCGGTLEPLEAVKDTQALVSLPARGSQALELLSFARCSTCSTTVCRGCSTQTSKCDCQPGPLSGLFAVLASLDEVYIQPGKVDDYEGRLSKPTEPTASAKKAKTTAAKAKKAAAANGKGKGVGYGGGVGAYYNYGGLPGVKFPGSGAAIGAGTGYSYEDEMGMDGESDELSYWLDDDYAGSVSMGSTAAPSLLELVRDAHQGLALDGAFLLSWGEGWDAAKKEGEAVKKALIARKSANCTQAEIKRIKDHMDTLTVLVAKRIKALATGAATATTAAAAGSKAGGSKANGAGAAFAGKGKGRSVNGASTTDEKLAALLKLLASLLPRPESQEPTLFDLMGHEALLPLLQLSALPELLAELLRNDSVAEWVRREGVYFALLDVLRALGESNAGCGLLAQERREKSYSEGVGKWMTSGGEIEWERPLLPVEGKGKKRSIGGDKDLEKCVLGGSLWSAFRNFNTQAEAFRKAIVAGNSAGGFEGDDVTVLGLAGDVQEVGDRLKTSIAVWKEQAARDAAEMDLVASATKGKGGKGKSKGKEREEEVSTVYSEADYARACRTLAYAQIPLSGLIKPGDGQASKDGKTHYPGHYYAPQLLATANAKMAHNGMVHLAKELAVLSTNLPPGIWVRVDEERIGCVKAMIAGPEDTPYAGGLFEFDIFIPIEYPNVAPSVWLKTTGDNKVRFNPNLYNTGKVCLSLIGTWSGSAEEQWQPKTSTILQVLISIQSMILGTNYPYYNEPGYGAPTDSAANKSYNMNISLACIKHAINYWLQPHMADSIWADVVNMHFQFRKPFLSRQLTTWASKDARILGWTAAHNAMAGLTEQQYRGAYGQVAAGAPEDLVKSFERLWGERMGGKEEKYWKEMLED